MYNYQTWYCKILKWISSSSNYSRKCGAGKNTFGSLKVSIKAEVLKTPSSGESAKKWLEKAVKIDASKLCIWLVFKAVFGLGIYPNSRQINFLNFFLFYFFFLTSFFLIFAICCNFDSNQPIVLVFLEGLGKKLIKFACVLKLLMQNVA